MARTQKRWVALLLALVMAIGLAPAMTIGASADGVTYYLGSDNGGSGDIKWTDLAAAGDKITGLDEGDTIEIASEPPGGASLIIDAPGVTVTMAGSLAEVAESFTINVDTGVASLTLKDLNAQRTGVIFLEGTAPVTLTVAGESAIGPVSTNTNLNISGSAALSTASDAGNAINVTGALSFSNALTATAGSAGSAIQASEIIFNGTGTSSGGTRLTITDTAAASGEYKFVKGTSVPATAAWSSSRAIAEISGTAPDITVGMPVSTATAIWLRAIIPPSGDDVSEVVNPYFDITRPLTNAYTYEYGIPLIFETESSYFGNSFKIELVRAYDDDLQLIQPAFFSANAYKSENLWKKILNTEAGKSEGPPSILYSAAEAHVASARPKALALNETVWTNPHLSKEYSLSSEGLVPGRYKATLTSGSKTVERFFYYGEGNLVSSGIPQDGPVLELDAPDSVWADERIDFKVNSNYPSVTLEYRPQTTNDWTQIGSGISPSSDWQTISLTDGIAKPGIYNIRLRSSSGDKVVTARLNVMGLFTPQIDGFQFKNISKSFGYTNNHRIDLQILTDVLGWEWYCQHSEYANALLSWGGSCYGFSTLSTSIYGGQLLKNALDINTIDIAAPNDSGAPLTKTFEAYQLLQGGDVLTEQWKETVVQTHTSPDGDMQFARGRRDTNQLEDLVNLVKQCDTGAPPVVVCVVGPMGNLMAGHAIVAYKAVETSKGIYDIHIYDCNFPKETRILNIDISGTTKARTVLGTWKYDLYNDKRFVWGTEYSRYNQVTGESLYTEISYDTIEAINGQIFQLEQSTSFAQYHISGHSLSTLIDFVMLSPYGGDVPLQQRLVGLLADGSAPAEPGLATYVGESGAVYTVSLGEGNAKAGEDFSVSVTEGNIASTLTTGDRTAKITIDPITGEAGMEGQGGRFDYEFADTTFSSVVLFKASGVGRGEMGARQDYGGFVLSGVTGPVEVEFTRDRKTVSGTVNAEDNMLIRMERDGAIGSYVYDEESGNYVGANGVSAAIFSDVSVSDWFYGYVNQAYSYGLIDGYGDGTFRPAQELTVAEFIKIAAVAANLELTPVGDGEWYQKHVNAVEKAGLIETGDAFYGDWNRPILREEMAQVTVRLFKMNYAEQLAGIDTSGVTFPDIGDVDPQYLEAVKLAYGIGLLRGVDAEGTFKPKSGLLRSEASAVITRIR